MCPLSGLNTAECFDVRAGEWRMIAAMSTRRSSVGVGVLNGGLEIGVFKSDFNGHSTTTFDNQNCFVTASVYQSRRHDGFDSSLCLSLK